MAWADRHTYSLGAHCPADCIPHGKGQCRRRCGGWLRQARRMGAREVGGGGGIGIGIGCGSAHACIGIGCMLHAQLLCSPCSCTHSCSCSHASRARCTRIRTGGSGRSRMRAPCPSRLRRHPGYRQHLVQQNGVAHQVDLVELVVVRQHDVLRHGASIRRGPLMLGTLLSACASAVSGKAARRAFRERAARMSRAVASPFFGLHTFFKLLRHTRFYGTGHIHILGLHACNPGWSGTRTALPTTAQHARPPLSLSIDREPWCW